MQTKLPPGNHRLTTGSNASTACARTKSLLMRLFWAAALVLPALGAHAGVIYTNLHSFDNNDGEYPQAGLVQGSDGNFYGTTFGGGTSGGYGTVFKISTNGAFNSLFTFNYTDGDNPEAALVQGNDGNLYGTTEDGGANNPPLGYGTVFKSGTNGPPTSLYSFGNIEDGSGIPLDGGRPSGPLVQASDGNFYGTTPYGGTNAIPAGTVFRISANGTFTNLYSFTGGTDGDSPEAGLVQGPDGNLYGTTYGAYGPYNIYGNVFKISTNGVQNNVYTFTGADGANPSAGLVLGSDGNFYGTTTSGGTYTNGTVFRVGSNGGLKTLYSFTGGIDGADPYAGLVQGSDGNFYGTTVSGGTYTNGTVFEIGTNGVLTTLYSFNTGHDGRNPYGGLVQGRDGSFYGTTVFGGAGNGYGTVFRLTVVPGPPQLTITFIALDSVVVSWPDIAGYILQTNGNLSTADWVAYGGTVTTANGTNTATITPPTGNLFFRLVNP
ncbi:MAG: choice-of-anchor tandem repeat GloVer-containing protein [Limisphaerales bacterium]